MKQCWLKYLKNLKKPSNPDYPANEYLFFLLTDLRSRLELTHRIADIPSIPWPICPWYFLLGFFVPCIFRPLDDGSPTMCPILVQNNYTKELKYTGPSITARGRECAAMRGAAVHRTMVGVETCRQGHVVQGAEYTGDKKNQEVMNRDKSVSDGL